MPDIEDVENKMDRSKRSDADIEVKPEPYANMKEYLEHISKIEQSGVIYVSDEDYAWLCDYLDDEEAE